MAADLKIITEPATRLADYARIPIAFEVTHRLSVEPTAGASSGPIALRLERQDPPYVKDYDAIDGCHPTRWPERYDVSRWWIASAVLRDERVGGVVVAFDARLVGHPSAGADAAVLWDLRVAPAHRRRGVGARLFRAAADYAVAQRCREMLIETQNTNVAACRFYAARGATLVHVDPHAYPTIPHEARLTWSKDLVETSDA